MGNPCPFWSDPKQITLGYAEAARSWFLAHRPGRMGKCPHEGDSPRTLPAYSVKIFLPTRTCSNGGTRTNEYLVWSGKDEFLEVHEATPQELAHSYTYRLAHPATVLTAVETFRVHSYLADSQSASGKVEELTGSFHAALVDREARLRGLKLAAADFIDVLNGERERRARGFLESVTGKRLATKAEWENFFSGKSGASLDHESGLCAGMDWSHRVVRTN